MSFGPVILKLSVTAGTFSSPWFSVRVTTEVRTARVHSVSLNMQVSSGCCGRRKRAPLARADRKEMTPREVRRFGLNPGRSGSPWKGLGGQLLLLRLDRLDLDAGLDAFEDVVLRGHADLDNVARDVRRDGVRVRGADE